jgi:hypothetical protein
MKSDAVACSAGGDYPVTTIAEGLTRDYQLFAQRLRTLADRLSQDEFWTKPFPYGNSVGHLVLHLTGNLNYYIGTQIAGTGYVRNRDLEFTDTARRPKNDVLDALDAAVAMVASTIRHQQAEDWSRPYTGVGSDARDRFAAVLRSAEHFFHHLGQIIYLVKEHERQRAQR